MAGKSIFEIFKKEKQGVATGSGKHIPITFKLLFDDAGAFVQIQDKNGAEVDVDYQHYSGAVRTVVKSIQAIKAKADFVIDWENPSNEIYLHKHEILIEPLLKSQLLQTEEGETVSAFQEKAILRLQLTSLDEEAHTLASKLVLWADNQVIEHFLFLNERYVFANNLVAETAPVGANFKALPFFNTTVNRDDLPKFLSIFFSFTVNIELAYEDYTVSITPEAIQTSPVLLFEKIDVDDALYMRVSQQLPGINAGLLNDYELSAFAGINDLERVIEVKQIEQNSAESDIEAIEKRLQKHLGKKEKKEGLTYILENDLFIIPREIAAEFIYNDLPDLLKTYQIMGAEQLKSYKISAIKPRLELRLSHGIDFLEGEASLHFNNEQFSLFDALQQYRKNKYILLSDGTHAIVNESYMQKLQRLFTKQKNNVHFSFFDLPLIEELIDEKVAAANFEKSRSIFEGFNNIHQANIPLPNTINATLRPYQEQGYRWLQYLHSVSLGGCLADDMGLGKTLQTIALLASIYPKESLPTLIVMPKSLLYNWEKELKKFAPQLSYYIYYAPSRNLEEAMEYNVILTTYAMVRNDAESLQEKQFYYVILDESQNIKNVAAQTSKAVMLLQGQHRLALSGTPIENNLGELYALFRFLNPSMFGSLEHFTQNYLTPIQRNNDQLIIDDLRKKIYPFILRRLKKEVLTELPDKIEQVLYVEMSDAQKKLYEQRRQYYQEAIQQQIAIRGIQSSQFFVFQALSELRQLASTPEVLSNGAIASPKVELLMEQLMDALANKHKVLVFVNFIGALELIGEKLDEQGVEYVSMSGVTKNRQQLVDRFQTDTNCRVFLLTLKTGGTGLNLTAADMVFIFDPWWNKAAENQAIDRSHRLGQDKTVLTYKLITQDTIEEKILMLQEQKAAIFNSIISTDSASLKAISEDDIQFMLGK